jgi:hypothetical protein
MLQISEEAQGDLLNADPSKLIGPSAKEAADFARHSIVAIDTSLNHLLELNKRRIAQQSDFLEHLDASERKLTSDDQQLGDDLNRTVDSMKSEINSAEYQRERAALTNFNPADLEATGINIAVLSEYRLAAMDSRDFRGEIERYEEKLVSRAEDEKHGLEQLLTTLTIASNVLYVLGASIGIFGTLAGIKSENPSE